MIGEQSSLEDLALAALKKAVARVIEEHRKAGESLVMWEGGKVVLVPPDSLSVHEESPPYGPGQEGPGRQRR